MTAPLYVLIAFGVLLIAGGTYVNIMDNREERKADERTAAAVRERLAHRSYDIDDNIRIRLSIWGLEGNQFTFEQRVSRRNLYAAHDPVAPIMYALDEVTYKMRQTIAEQLR